MNNYYTTNTSPIAPIVPYASVTLSGSLDIRDRDTLETITDTLDYITDTLTSLVSIIREVVALRVVAIE